MAVQGCFERDCCKKILLEFSAELFQVIQGQIIQLATLVQAIADSVANLLVCFTKGDALMHKIRCGSHSIQKATLAGSAHAVDTEFESSSKIRQQRNHHIDSTHCGKDRLLRLLHVLVVCKR